MSRGHKRLKMPSSVSVEAEALERDCCVEHDCEIWRASRLKLDRAVQHCLGVFTSKLASV